MTILEAQYEMPDKDSAMQATVRIPHSHSALRTPHSAPS
jgi:hypothetical protein